MAQSQIVYRSLFIKGRRSFQRFKDDFNVHLWLRTSGEEGRSLNTDRAKRQRESQVPLELKSEDGRVLRKGLWLGVLKGSRHHNR